MSFEKSCVLFDLDYTLFDLRQYSYGAFADFSVQLSERVGLLKSEIMKAFVNALEHGHRKVINRALQALGIEEYESLVAELVDLYRLHQPKLSLYPDVTPALQALHKMGYKLGLITNGTLFTQCKKVHVLGLRKMLDTIIYADALGRAHWKPSPLPYLIALDALGSHPSHAVYVGDDPQTDIKGALMVGMRAVRILRGELQHIAEDPAFPPDVTVTSLEELVSLIRDGYV